ncbi:predicted protein [Histoplasma capsulatum G186AR]|uniref:Uncharacterized protein n=1 Tax=Ajellomyces capsulatus (strain G186AR / H82 / ATCC MYA-2454 / RMSCC 2432) TaxID=447093 RepID=C0NGQ1_AJECG|nr:uncharacterized protein HCBG_02523 [Histoplasma capsulatum G186AR]EEH08986.1 predicted protein [Histoplasma capsulatum G186AR]
MESQRRHHSQTLFWDEHTYGIELGTGSKLVIVRLWTAAKVPQTFFYLVYAPLASSNPGAKSASHQVVVQRRQTIFVCIVISITALGPVLLRRTEMCPDTQMNSQLAAAFVTQAIRSG